MRRERLNDLIVTSVFVLNGLGKRLERPLALITAVNAAMPGAPEMHIFVLAPKLSRRAMIIVRPGHEPTMDLQDEVSINRPIGREFRNPAVSLHSRMCLPLRSSHELLRCLPHGSFEFTFSKFGPLDSGRPSNFSLQLNLLQPFNPPPLIGDCFERQNRGFGLSEGISDAGAVIDYPAPRPEILNHVLI